MTCPDTNPKRAFEIAAPYPALTTTIILKNPYVGDSESIRDAVSTKRAVDGTLYTYVKTKGGRRKLKWEFTLSRNKCLEMENFIIAYFASKVRVVDHNGRIWVGNFTGNPFDFTGSHFTGVALQDWPVGEDYTFSIEFEGIEQ